MPLDASDCRASRPCCSEPQKRYQERPFSTPTFRTSTANVPKLFPKNLKTAESSSADGRHCNSDEPPNTLTGVDLRSRLRDPSSGKHSLLVETAFIFARNRLLANHGHRGRPF